MKDDRGFARLGDERQFQIDRDGRRRRQLRPMPPKQCRVEKTGRGVRAHVLDWDRTPSTPNPNSTVEYRVRWVQLCDLSTTQGIASAFARAVTVATIPATGGEAEAIITDEDKQTGYFFFTGADSEGNESEYTTPPRFLSGQGLSSTIPDNVTRFSASESGEERDGTIWSVVALSMLAPDPLGSFFAVQPVLENYPRLGQITSFSRREYGGVGGGKIEWEMLFPVGRRKGKGTVTATNGVATVTFGGAENCLSSVAAGEYLEILGVSQQIKSVDGAGQVTLGIPGGASQNWSGKSVVALADYDFIASVTFYMRSLSQDGNGETDLSKLPSQTVLLDGNLSAPNAPVVTASVLPSTNISSMGNVNRLFLAPVLGTEVKSYRLDRGKGAGVAASACTPIKTLMDEHTIIAAPFQIDDTDFTVNEKEAGQVWSYYGYAINARDQVSAASTRVEVACRLDNSADNDPGTVARNAQKNLLYNAMLMGSPPNAVADTDTNQDAAYADIVAGTLAPGTPYGGSGQTDGFGRLKGYTRWHSTKTASAIGLAVTNPNGVFFLPGANVDSQAVYVFQEIGAWDHLTQQLRKVEKDFYYVLSVFVQYNAGFPPNGSLNIVLEQYNNNAYVATVPSRTRDANGSLTFVDAGGGPSNEFSIPASNIPASPSWTRFHAVFKTMASLGTTKQLRVTFAHKNTTNGNGLKICRPMLSVGEELANWTPDMGDTNISISGSPGPGAIGDGDGLRGPLLPYLP